MSDLAHSGRLSLITREVSWRLSADAVVVSTGPDSKTIPYANVLSLRLITYAGTGGTQGRAIVTCKGQDQQKIGSHHYVSLANFENRLSTYAPFVRELARRIAAANPQARFVAGSLGIWLTWLIVCLLMLGVAVLIAAVAMEATPPWLRLTSTVLLVVTLGPAALRWARRSLPRAFDPNDIPMELLGRARQ